MGLSHTARRAKSRARAADAARERERGSTRPEPDDAHSSRSSSPAPDPVRCCEALEGLPYRLFLDSASTASRLGRYSFLTADPVAIVRSRGARRECLDLRTGARARDQRRSARRVARARRAVRAEPVSGLPPFQGGAAGYVAYDWGLTLERLPAPRYDDLALPDVVLGIYDWVWRGTTRRREAWLISTGIPGADCATRVERAPPPRGIGAAAAGGAVGPPACGPRRSRPRPSDPSHRRRASRRPIRSTAAGGTRLPLRSSFTRDAYLDAVARVREYIFAGDIFQANLSQRFEAPLAEPPWAFYRGCDAGTRRRSPPSSTFPTRRC